MHPVPRVLIGIAVLSLLVPMTAGPANAAPVAHALPISASTECQSAVGADVNGDGYAEVAVGEPGASAGRGAVHLFYGYGGSLQTRAKGTARNDLALTQATAGVPGTSEKGDRFGTTTLLADVNSDGCADLVVGVPGEDGQSGSLSVLYGSPRGLTTSGAQQIKSSILFRPQPFGLNELGSVLTSGDFDGDGVLDVAATGMSGGEFGLPSSVVVLYGNARGLGRGRAPVQLTPAMLGLPGELFGMALSSGDYDGDGDTELAVGTMNRGAGGVQIVQRHGASLVAGISITVDSTGWPGRRSAYTSLGSVLASGDVQADGFDDLVVADPDYDESTGDKEYGQGAVVVLSGSRAGLAADRSQFWTQGSPGVQGSFRHGHQFGGALAVGRVNADASDDLVVGAPAYSGWLEEQSATVLLGSRNGLTTKGVGGTRYTQSTRGITGTNERGDIFGASLSIAQLSGSGPGAVIIGAPGEDVGSIRDAGSITRLGVSDQGPNPRHSQTITLSSAGVRGSAEPRGHFGAALS